MISVLVSLLDGDVHNASALVRNEHQDEQQTARRRRDDEDIGCHHLSDVIPQERAPVLGWRLPVATRAAVSRLLVSRGTGTSLASERCWSPRVVGRCSRRRADRLFKSRISAVCTITPNLAPPPEDRSRATDKMAALWRWPAVEHPHPVRVALRVANTGRSGILGAAC